MLWLYVKSLIDGMKQNGKNRLPDLNQRPHNMQHGFFDLKGKKMGQAKVLTDKELRKVLNYVAMHKHAARNRVLVLTTHLCGVRVKELAAILIGDVVNADGTINDQVRLTCEQTKGRHSRTVYLPEKLRKELATYIEGIDTSDKTKPLFSTQKRDGFTANTLCQWFHWTYKKVGIEGASSHSGRRSFITNLANKGVGVRVLMELAGHRSMAVTQKYIDANPAMMRRAVELI